MKKTTLMTTILVGAFLFAGCSAETSPTPADNVNPEVQAPSLADVSDVEILTVPEAAAQVRVLTRGSLPNACALLNEPVIDRQETAFVIQLNYALDQSKTCAQQITDFEIIIPLDLTGMQDGEYIISVNNVSATYPLVTVRAESESPSVEPEITPTETAPVENIPVTAEESAPVSAPQPESDRGCTDVAAFYGDVSIPDNTSFEQNVPFIKAWAIRNEGTCTWSEGYSLVFAGGDIMNGALSTPMPEIKPGEIGNIGINLVSPAQGGLYTGYYEFENPEGDRFGVNSGGGDKIWVAISVSWYQPGETAPSAGIPESKQNSSCGYSENPAYISQLADLINNARANEGLPALEVDSRLSAAATKHSLDMGCQRFLDHTGSDGSKFGQRVQAQGYTYSYVSENIYAGSPDFGGNAQGAFDWWMNSTVHRNNILSKKVTQIGIGYVNVPGSEYGGYYTLNFARP